MQCQGLPPQTGSFTWPQGGSWDGLVPGQVCTASCTSLHSQHKSANSIMPGCLPAFPAVCQGLPAQTASFTWPQDGSCDDLVPGQICTATCTAPAVPQPNPPAAVCGPDGNWTVVGGACGADQAGGTPNGETLCCNCGSWSAKQLGCLLAMPVSVVSSSLDETRR